MNKLWIIFLLSIRLLTQITLLPFVFLLIGCDANPQKTNFDSRVFSKIKILGGLGTAPGKFVKPRSIAVDLEDNVYICDMTGRIQKFDKEGEYILQWQMPQIEKGRPKMYAPATPGTTECDNASPISDQPFNIRYDDKKPHNAPTIVLIRIAFAM